MLFSSLASSNEIITEVLLKSTINLKVEFGKPASLYPVIFKNKACTFQGEASLNSGNHRVDINLTSKSCNGTSTPINGLVSAIDGKAGLPVKCKDAYTNSVGNKLCAEANLTSGTVATVIGTLDR